MDARGIEDGGAEVTASPAGLGWDDAVHAGVRGLVATLLLVPVGLWAASSYDVAAAGYAFAMAHFQRGSGALILPLVVFLGLLAVPAGLVERRLGPGDAARQHVRLLLATAAVVVLGLPLVVVQASYVIGLWQLGLQGGWQAAAARLQELGVLVRKLPVDTLLLTATFATPFLTVAAIRSHRVRAGRLVFRATAFSALLAGLIYASIAPETQRLAWLTPDAPTLGRPRLIATWAALVGALGLVLAVAALAADRVAGGAEPAPAER